MRLILAVVDDSDGPALIEAFHRAGLRVTRLASTGGFLLEGNTTLLVGIRDDQVEPALQTIRETCRRRTRLVPQPVVDVPGAATLPMEVEVGGAVVWILTVERVERF